MQLPDNFWEEFDRRLEEKLEEKLEAKLEAKLAPIHRKLKEIDGWTKRQDRMLEHEIHTALRTHLEDRLKRFLVVIPTIFPKTMADGKGTITEFVGLLLLTNHKPVAEAYMGKPDTDIVKAFHDIEKTGAQAFLVIAEAKQELTLAKFAKKQKQKERIEALIRRCREDPSSIPSHIAARGLQYLEPTVGLYVGGQEVDDSVKHAIRHEVEQNGGSFCGWLELNGARFSVQDRENDFGQPMLGGGKRPQRNTNMSLHPIL